MSWPDRIERMDRRIIFLAVAVAVLVPLIIPIGLPVGEITRPVLDFKQAIDELQDGDVVMLAADYDPGSKAELYPMNVAVLEHIGRLKKNIRVIALTLLPTGGVQMAQKAFEEISEAKYGWKYGVDYINLGFKEGREVVMVSLGESFRGTFPQDYRNVSLDEYPIMNGVDNYEPIDLFVAISVGYPGAREWVLQVQRRFNLKMIAGMTTVTSPEIYPYYTSGQLAGTLSGLKSVAEYEQASELPGPATVSMDAISIGHFVMIFFILLGNGFYVYNRYRKSGRPGSRTGQRQ